MFYTRRILLLLLLLPNNQAFPTQNEDLANTRGNISTKPEDTTSNKKSNWMPNILKTPWEWVTGKISQLFGGSKEEEEMVSCYLPADRLRELHAERDTAGTQVREVSSENQENNQPKKIGRAAQFFINSGKNTFLGAAVTGWGCYQIGNGTCKSFGGLALALVGLGMMTCAKIADVFKSDAPPKEKPKKSKKKEQQE